MKTKPVALVLEDQLAWQTILTEILADLELQTDVCGTLAEATERITEKTHRIAIIDLSLELINPNDRSGLEALDYLRKHDPGCAAILLSGYTTVGVAVSAIKEFGAFTCLQKETFQRNEFMQIVQKALNQPPAVAARTTVRSGQQVLATITNQKPPAVESARILLVDDDAGWRSVLEELVTDAGYAAVACSSYGEALGAIRKSKFDLVILDLVLSSSNSMVSHESDGILLLDQIKNSDSAIIIVSGEASPAVIDQLFSSYPISSFFEKRSFQRSAALQQIQDLLEKRQPNSDIFVGLTRREIELFELIAKGYTNQQIADQLLITVNTVKRHAKAIFRKMGIHNRSAAAALFAGKYSHDDA
jgi:DNA-binding NarL/FixJ family response regulator